MTDEEICTLLDWCYPDADRSEDALLTRIKRVIEEAQKQERERCAKMCESQEDFEYATGKVDHNERSWCSHLAAAIRDLK